MDCYFFHAKFHKHNNFNIMKKRKLMILKKQNNIIYYAEKKFCDYFEKYFSLAVHVSTES